MVQGVLSGIDQKHVRWIRKQGVLSARCQPPAESNFYDCPAKGSTVMKKWSVLVTGSALAALSLGFEGVASAAPTGATAWPTGCVYRNNQNNGAMATCDRSNGGHYKASVQCNRLDGGGVITLDAPVWRTSGWSYVFCPSLTVFSSAAIITKSS